jgi:hypothetical protein
MRRQPLKPIPEVQQPPRCFKAGCDDWGSFGFSFPGGRQEWACSAHREEMDTTWSAAVQAKVDADAENLKLAQGSLL